MSAKDQVAFFIKGPSNSEIYPHVFGFGKTVTGSVFG
jgi:hypothetical protein